MENTPTTETDIMVVNMIKAKEHLLKIELTEANENYKKILLLIDNFLFENCVHKILHDYIDIDPDKTKLIYYCEKCNLTF